MAQREYTVADVERGNVLNDGVEAESLLADASSTSESLSASENPEQLQEKTSQSTTGSLKGPRLGTEDIGDLNPRVSSGGNFLQRQKSRIYTARDFASKTLTTRQKIAVLVIIIVLFFIIKAVAIDPFRTDRDRWEKKKTIVDEAVREEVLKNPALLTTGSDNSVFQMNETRLEALERAAEEFVKQEEGDQV